MSLDENAARGNAAGDEVLAQLAPLPAPASGFRLWWCVLDASQQRLRACNGYLSDAERMRAARFGHPSLRERYVVGRGSLRALLGRELAIAPGEVPIIRGARGRPQLAGDAKLDFNVSHTGSVAIVAVSRDGRVGVDVERLDRAINVAGIARKFLTAAERDAIAPLDADAARRTVLTLWTCKEAMSKATGDALSAPFAAIDVDLREGPALRSGPGAYRPERWSLFSADVPQGHVATLAVWRG